MAKKKTTEFNVMDHIKTKHDLDLYCEAYAEPYVRALIMAVDALQYIDEFPDERADCMHCDIYMLADYAKAQRALVGHILSQHGVTLKAKREDWSDKK